MDDGRRIVVAWRPGPDVRTDEDVLCLPRTGEIRTGRVAPGRDQGNPLFTVPALVLLAALAIFEGYRCLQIIPGGSLRPPGLVFALAVVPATLGLTRHTAPGRAAALRWLALGCSAAVPLLSLIVLIGHSTAWARVLGVASLGLAASLLALAALCERSDRISGTR